MRLNLQSTLLVRCLTIGEPNEKENTDPEREHKSTAPQWEETRTAFCRWKGGTTPRYKKAFNRVASKLNTLLKTLHATPHQLPDTRNFSITIESTSVHPCKNPRQHSKMDTYLEMLMPRAKHVSKKHDALFLIDPFVWPRKHTQKEKCIRNFRHTRENDDNNNNDPFGKNNLQNCTRRGFSVPSSHQCAEPETTEKRTAQKHPKNHSKTQTKSQSQKQTTKPHHNTTCN